jgi:hypothetical protein
MMAGSAVITMFQFSMSQKPIFYSPHLKVLEEVSFDSNSHAVHCISAGQTD